MDEEDIKRKVWDILPRMTNVLKDVLSIAPLYNAHLSKVMGIHPAPKNRGSGNFLLWTLLRDNRTSGDVLGVGAIETDSTELYSNKNIVVSGDVHNDAVVNCEEEIVKQGWAYIQTYIGELCELLKTYIKTYPHKAYGGAFLKDMDINLCKFSASGEFVDYLVKILLKQGVLDYTGEKGPRGSHMLKIAKDIPYEIQVQLDPVKFRRGISRGEALASLTFDDILPELHIVHQKKWKECKDKKRAAI